MFTCMARCARINYGSVPGLELLHGQIKVKVLCTFVLIVRHKNLLNFHLSISGYVKAFKTENFFL